MNSNYWQRICSVDRVTPDRGVAALVYAATGQPFMVAIFRLSSVGRDHPEQWLAVDHLDPIANAPVMARGLVGSCGEVPTVASPINKRRYDLRTGETIEGDGPSLRSWRVRVIDAQVEVDATTSLLRNDVMA